MTHTTDITSRQEFLSQPPTAGNINVIPNPPRKKLRTSRLFRSKETKGKNKLKQWKMNYLTLIILENLEAIWIKMKN